ncbi:MAG: phosphatase PAP2 family protein [Candidatus Paceibacterota bacterium]
MTDVLVIFAAKYFYILAVCIFLYYGYTAEHRFAFIRLTLITAALALVLSVVASALYYNPRPFMVTGVPPLVAHTPGNGFPSDHALLTGTLAAVMTMANPFLGGVLWLIAIVVGAGRVLANVHHSIDVVTSFLIAAVSVLVVHYALRRYAKPGK